MRCSGSSELVLVPRTVDVAAVRIRYPTVAHITPLPLAQRLHPRQIEVDLLVLVRHEV